MTETGTGKLEDFENCLGFRSPRQWRGTRDFEFVL
jgi:hypothetical protein